MKIFDFKKYFALLIIGFVLIAGLSSCAKRQEEDLMQKVLKRDKLVIGVKYDTKPFGFIDKNQKLQGFDIDLSREIAKRLLGREDAVEFQQVTTSSRIISLTSGNVDMVIASMTITPKRRRVIDFSNPYYIASQALMVPVSSNIQGVHDLNGKRVIVILGSTAEETIRNLCPNASVLGFRTYTDAFSSLRANRADALVTDDIIISGLMIDNPGYKMIKQNYSKEPYGIGFKKSPETLSIQEQINGILENMRSDGTLARIRKKWILE